MRTLKLVVAYDGTHFSGWQRQPKLRTVQGAIETALGKLPLQFEKLIASGRTDAGVHALGQVVSLRADTRMEPYALVRALNRLLPPDVVVQGADWAPEGFHARHAAKSKIYLYQIWRRELPSPFSRPYSWHIPFPLNLEAMREGARHLVGTHDFSAFRVMESEPQSSQRTVFRLDLVQEEDFLKVFAEANGFLHHMVRNIVGTLVEVGRGRFRPDQVQTILESRDRRRAGPTAPPQGLFLYRVNY
ncbi:MAG: tRNA pseudouridine(38-40) synthase TruA [Candidatus Tectomicrobia bacterium]|uniref:tRNA pseudouridine synthase A n=1 Tax=Tectimicrobiota bacterium TaxID=2528274 RepID=A0A932G011_UNCTE|nr:tRNA pseudouridine(38-40) synthase TruA [Candidatus Tectomicrobia bacterium]